MKQHRAKYGQCSWLPTIHSWHISNSKPGESTITAEQNLMGGENYYSALFDFGNGNYVLALCFFKDYECASEYMDYFIGVTVPTLT